MPMVTHISSYRSSWQRPQPQIDWLPTNAISQSLNKPISIAVCSLLTQWTKFKNTIYSAPRIIRCLPRSTLLFTYFTQDYVRIGEMNENNNRWTGRWNADWINSLTHMHDAVLECHAAADDRFFVWRGWRMWGAHSMAESLRGVCALCSWHAGSLLVCTVSGRAVESARNVRQPNSQHGMQHVTLHCMQRNVWQSVALHWNIPVG